MELYDAIFYRKSTRKYSNKKVKEGLLEEVKNACSQITYLNKELDIKAHVVDRGHLVHFLMGKKCKVKAPHYIIVTSNKGNDYLQNIGFAMEEVVLKLTTLGLATCWLECNIKREDILEFVQLKDSDEEKNDTIVESEEKNEESKNVNLEQPYSIIAFGYPDEDSAIYMDWTETVYLADLLPNTVYIYTADHDTTTPIDIINNLGENCMIYEKDEEMYEINVMSSDDLSSSYSFSFVFLHINEPYLSYYIISKVENFSQMVPI